MLIAEKEFNNQKLLEIYEACRSRRSTAV